MSRKISAELAWRPLETSSQDTLSAIRPNPAKRSAKLARRSSVWSERSNVVALTQPIMNARWARDRGQAMTDFLANLPPDAQRTKRAA